MTALARCSERVWLEASSETESVCPWIWTLGTLESLRTAARLVTEVDPELVVIEPWPPRTVEPETSEPLASQRAGLTVTSGWEVMERVRSGVKTPVDWVSRLRSVSEIMGIVGSVRARSRPRPAPRSLPFPSPTRSPHPWHRRSPSRPESAASEPAKMNRLRWTGSSYSSQGR